MDVNGKTCLDLAAGFRTACCTELESDFHYGVDRAAVAMVTEMVEAMGIDAGAGIDTDANIDVAAVVVVDTHVAVVVFRDTHLAVVVFLDTHVSVFVVVVAVDSAFVVVVVAMSFASPFFSHCIDWPRFDRICEDLDGTQVLVRVSFVVP